MNILDLIAEERTSILYRPSFRQLTKSITGAIFLSQAIYWWVKNGRQPFYKFNNQCSHNLYKEGDSWCEELAFTKRELEGLKKLSWIVRTKGNEPMPKNCLIRFWVDNNNVTWWELNEEHLNNSLSNLNTESSKTCISRDPQKGNPGIHKMGITYNTKITTKNNPPIVPQKGDDVDQDDEKEKSFQEIWNMYPKKQAKQQAKKVWMRKTNSVTKYHEEIMKDLSIRLKTEWLEKDLKYIPMLSVYLNNRRWEDEYDGKPSLEQELNREYALYQLDCFDVDKKPLTKERWMTEIRGKS